MDSILTDLRYALRSLYGNRGLAAVALLTIALGIGANSAIFSVVRAVLLRPLPYQHPEELVVVWSNLVARDLPKFPLSPPDLRDFQEQLTRFDDFAGVATFTQTLTGADGPAEQIQVGGITWNFFRVLGVSPARGRDFLPEDGAPLTQDVDPTTLPPTAVVLSHELWQRRFGGDPDIVGQTLEVNQNPVQVAGVLPAGFRIYFGPGAGLAEEVDLWTVLRIDVDAWAARRNVIWRVVGRMSKGTTVAQAQAEMDALAARFREDDNLRETAQMRLDVVPMIEDLTAGIRPVVLALLGAVVFVLLIACANVSNLLLVRAVAREREFAIRSAMGGPRSRLLRQLLLESGVLAAGGGLLGLGVAVGGIRLLLALRPANLPRMDTVGIDPWVLGFTTAATLASALIFGIVPALEASRPRVADALRDRGLSSVLGRQRLFRNGLVVGEVALSVMLLIGAGLMIRSFVALHRVDPGYDTADLLTFQLSLPGNRYSNAEREVFQRTLKERLTALPGAVSFTGVFPLPLVETLFSGRYGPEAALTDESLYGQATYRVVLPGYFETMGTRIVEGRVFTEAEHADSSLVVVIDDKLARILWPGESAVGKRMLVRATTLDPQFVEVIGVVGHERSQTLAADGQETVYLTDRYAGGPRALHYVLRTSTDPTALMGPVRRVVEEMDPQLPVADMRTMEARVQQAMTGTRFALVLIGVFGLIALVLASIGIYGVLAYSVRHRTAEIGVRMALGAQAQSILGLVVRQGLGLTAVGLGAGLLAGFWATRLMTSMLVDVAPTDLPTFGAMAGVFVLVAAVACWIPARRATRVDPMTALRSE